MRDFLFHRAADDHAITGGPPLFLAFADIPAGESFTIEEGDFFGMAETNEKEEQREDFHSGRESSLPL